MPGTYIFSLVANDGQTSSAPNSVTIKVPALGDIDLDGDIDVFDIAKILAALNTSASGSNDLRDLNGDGKIDFRDVVKAVGLCTRPLCAAR